ncbi:hypothetical protein CUR178_00550 [Leishmania enriettii]|uniref:Uncharacterized protein n=1 Tax=Leishmania enriettii TaxID=5663 RepID=A0A836GVI6_LEIEN|nr:hypothetical protein CUR178_00550 [Leishmania enriettii]
MPTPPSYRELANVVNDYLTKGSDVHGWLLEAREDGATQRLSGYPFASPSGVGIDLCCKFPEFNTTLTSKVSAVFQSWREYLPTIMYETRGDSASAKIEVDTAAASVMVTAEHPVFNISCKTSPVDGFVTDADVATRVSEQLYAGAYLQYDPKRSGVRDFTTVMVRYACPNIGNGDLLGKYSLQRGLSLHLRIPIHAYMDAAVAAERGRFIAGVQARSPCGARLMLNTNVTDGTCTMTAIRNMNDIWRVTATVTRPFASGGRDAVPRFGLKLTNMNALD